MLEILEFTFQDIWHFLGILILLCVVVNIFAALLVVFGRMMQR